MAHDSRKYHLEMILNTLRNLKYPNKGDTRNYVDFDEGERNILAILIQSELDKLNDPQRAI